MPSLPFELQWKQAPAQTSSDGAAVTVIAPATSDYFIDPAGTTSVLNAPHALTTPPVGDWQFSARVTVEFKDTYDAGALMLWADKKHWAKLCFERSPALAGSQGRDTIVSVITRTTSDDANAWEVGANTVWLRISRVNGAYAFHSSNDGKLWSLVRYFSLVGSELMQVGLAAQSPLGQGCSVVFDNCCFTETTLADLRDGS